MRLPFHLLFCVLAFAQPSPDLPQLIASGKYKDAERLARERLTNLEQQQSSDTREAADVLDLLVESLWRQGIARGDVKPLAQRAVTLRERVSPNTFAHARALFNLANVHDNAGDYPAYKATLARAVEIGTAARGADDPDVAMFVSVLGMAHRSLGEYEAARAHLERALAVRRRYNPDDVNVAKIQHNLGAVLWDLGHLDAARGAFRESTRLFEKTLGPTHPIVPNAYEGFGVLLLTMGDYAGARDVYDRTLRLRQQILPAGHPEIASSYSNLGDLQLALGDYAGARQSLERALAIWTKAHGPDHPVLTVATTNLGGALVRLGDLRGAERAFRQVVAAREKAGDHANLVIPLRELANVLALSGRADHAWPLYRRARELGERTRGAGHPYVASTALDEARQLVAHGRSEDAAPLVEHALATYERILSRNHPDYAAALDVNARLLAGRGDRSAALDMALEAEAIARRHFQETAAALPERQALLYADARTRSQDLAVSLALAAKPLDRGALERLWDTVVRSRALVLDEMARRSRFAAGEDDPKIAALQRDLASARGRLAALVLRGPKQDAADAYRKELDAARVAKERLEVALAAQQPRLQAAAHAGFVNVRNALPPGSALVSYVRFGGAGAGDVPGYAAFVATDGFAAPVLVPLGDAAAIDALVASWRRRILDETTAPSVGARKREDLYRGDAVAVRRRIWDPIAELLANASRVLIVPHGPLHLLDFGALPVGKAEYLAERTVLHYLAAERDLLRDERALGFGLLALGGPAFHRAPAPVSKPFLRSQSQPPCEPMAGTPVQPLPGSIREVEQIAGIWREQGRDVVALTGVRASEAHVRRLAPGRRVLHLATHGFFLNERCANRALGGDHPLLSSGLVLAGAARPASARAVEGQDDGVLTAEEIASLDLSGVEWAVLSACDSGTGPVRAGEGVLGLRRAFQVAGASTVIMSLWPVDDEITRRWMVHLYESRFVRQRPTAEAVRDANLALLTARRRASRSTHPFYWTGFVAAGDWR